MTFTHKEHAPEPLRGALAYQQLLQRLPPPTARAALRRAAGVSLRDIADAVGVTPTAVAFWELGQRTPRREHLQAYLAVLEQLAASIAPEGRA